MTLDKKLLTITLRNTALAAIYIFLVSQVMQNGDKLFGKTDSMFTPFVVLMLFCLSAAVVGGLVLAQSLMLFLEGKMKEGIKVAIYSVVWLGIYTALGLILLVITR